MRTNSRDESKLHGDLIRPLVLCLATVLLVACPAQTQERLPEEKRIVEVAKPRLLAESVRLQALGRLEGADEAQLGFSSPGVVREVRVDIGDRVRAGQLLATLDTTALDADLRQAREQAAQARRDAVRMETLGAQQLVARQQMDDARSRLAIADARVRSSESQRRYGQILAKNDGLVLARSADPGEVVAAGQPVLAVSSARNGWRMRVEVADRHAVRLFAGAPSTVTFDAFPGVRFPAEIREIGGRASAGSGAITVDLELKPSAQPLRSGLVGRAELLLPSESLLSIPVGALVRADARSGRILLARQGRAVARTVQLGRIRGDHIEVLSGINAADDVIVEGAAWVTPGADVTPGTGR